VDFSPLSPPWIRLRGPQFAHPCRRLLCSKIAELRGIEVHDVRTRKFAYFRKIFRFSLNNIRDVTKGRRGHNPPSAESLLETKKSQQCHKHFFQNSIFASGRPQVPTKGRQTCFLPQAPSNLLTPCTSRLSSQNGESCLQKYLPISGKLSIPNYLKQNDYRRY